MNSDTASGSPFPDEIPNSRRGELHTPVAANIDPPTPGTNAAAIDYRANPSAHQVDQPYQPNDRDHPNAAGTITGPPPDKTIQTYDLPDQLSSYDHMGER